MNNKKQTTGRPKDILLKLFLTAFFGGLVFSTYNLFIKLHVEAYRNRSYLNKVVILEGRETIASAKPNGDALTGSSSPAYAEFDVDDTLENLYEQTMVNLKRQGYSGDGYADTSTMDGNIGNVSIKSTKGTKSIVLEYGFANSYVCDATNNMQKPCYFDSYKDVYSSGLKGTKINKLKVFYDNN